MKSAELLLENAMYEDATSRAYYSMFHATKAILATIKEAPKSHSGVVRVFGEKFIRTGVFPMETGKALALAKGLREKADYEPTPAIPKEQAKHLIEEAKKFLKAMRDYLQTISEG